MLWCHYIHLYSPENW